MFSSFFDDESPFEKNINGQDNSSNQAK